MADEIESKVLAALASAKHLPPEKVSMESSLEELGIDSLDTINLLFELEDEFKVSIPDEEARSIHNARQIVEGIRKLVAERSGKTGGAK